MDSIRALAGRDGSFSISIEADSDPGSGTGELRWTELLWSGLSFDLLGLSDGPHADAPPGEHVVGLDGALLGDCEGLVLRPGPHLSGGSMMVPVLRSLARLAAELCELENLVGVGWLPANNVCSPAFFADHVKKWVDGGVFPGLALVSFEAHPDGGLSTLGLAQFTGQELLITPEMGEEQAQRAKLALRLLDFLVRQGRLEQAELLTGPDGRPLHVVPAEKGCILRVGRG